MGGEELHRMPYTNAIGAGHMYGVTAVVVRGIAHVPAVDAMWCPGASLSRGLMENYLGTQRGQGGPVEIEGAVEVFFG